MDDFKGILISIKPRWCELIASGIKTIEVRKTKPRIDTPFKCYIYETKTKDYYSVFHETTMGKVIGEFVCDKITEFYPTMDLNRLTSNHIQMVDKSCVNMRDLYNYANDKILYAWQISDLKIYDKPKELSEFYTRCRMDCELCKMWGHTRVNADEFDMDCKSDWVNHKPILRPPQSWCYAKEAYNG